MLIPGGQWDSENIFLKDLTKKTRQDIIELKVCANVKWGQVKKRVGFGISNFFLKCRGEFADVKNNFQNKKMFYFHENFSLLVSEVNFMI